MRGAEAVQRPISRRAVVLVALLAAAAVLVLLVQLRQHAGMVRAGPTPVAFSIGIDTSGDTVDDCDTNPGTGVGATCVVTADAAFTVRVYLDGLPGGVDYKAFDLHLTYSGVVSQDNASATQWPACFAQGFYFSPGHVRWGCSILSLASSYTGLIGTNGFLCQGGAATGNAVALVHGNPADTRLITEVGTAYAESGPESLTINGCDAAAPVPLELVAPNLNKPWGVFLTNADGSGAGEEGGSAASTSDATSIYYAESGDNQIHVKVLKSGSDTVIAGSGSPGGYDCNNCTASTAKLNGPRDVFYAAVDSALYIADTQNCLVRKVSGGTITTVAGVAPDPLAHCGYDGEGPATSHQLNKPSGVSVAPNGDIYIADTLSCLVRKVSAGTMSTVAGIVPSPTANCGSATAYPAGPAPDDFGPATSAVLRYPYDVSLLYPDTDLLIAEGADTSADGLSSGHNRIRRVEVPGGIITTAAGGGTCAYGDGTYPPYTSTNGQHLCNPLEINLSNPEGVAAADYKIYIAQAGDATHPIVTTHAVTNAVAPVPVEIDGITVNQVKSVAVNSAQTNGIRSLAISIFGTGGGGGGIGSGNDLGGNPSASYRPTSGCTALPGIQSIDWALPAALLGMILGRKRSRTLLIVLRSSIRPGARVNVAQQRALPPRPRDPAS